MRLVYVNIDVTRSQPRLARRFILRTTPHYCTQCFRAIVSVIRVVVKHKHSGIALQASNHLSHDGSFSTFYATEIAWNAHFVNLTQPTFSWILSTLSETSHKIISSKSKSNVFCASCKLIFWYWGGGGGWGLTYFILNNLHSNAMELDLSQVFQQRFSWRWCNKTGNKRMNCATAGTSPLQQAVNRSNSKD